MNNSAKNKRGIHRASAKGSAPLRTASKAVMLLLH